MVITRILLSLIMIPGFFLLFYLDHRLGSTAPVLFIVTNLLAIRGSWEMVNLLRTRSFEPRFPLVTLCNVFIVSSCWWLPLHFYSHPELMPTGIYLLGSNMLAFSLCILVLFFVAAIGFREPGKTMETLSSEVLILVYVGLLLSMTAQLKWVAGAEADYLILGSLIIAVKGGDVGAYFIGRMLGREKMVPRLSPAKTWWGARGALVMSTLFSVIWLYFMPPWFETGWPSSPILWSILYGLIIGVVGIVGDLSESLIKRDVGRKDAAALMPGFGGLLDILDSILYAGPVAFLMWSLFPLAGWIIS